MIKNSGKKYRKPIKIMKNPETSLKIYQNYEKKLRKIIKNEVKI